ncbi:hypothetical protein BJV82DRAFT_585447 [Fennellomyces sp. T-0311]|nr:hypothetical protein BJV82DRAFT_585447 [Fennellomyces sp. T-0311]
MQNYYNMGSNSNMNMMPSSPPSYYSPSTAALLSGLQQQHQQEHYPSNVSVLGSQRLEYPYEDEDTSSSITAFVPEPQVKKPKLKKKKSFSAFAKKALVPTDPSFWSPREAKQNRKRPASVPPPVTRSNTKTEMPGAYPPSAPATPAVMSTPATNSSALQSPPPAIQPPPPAPFSLPQIPAGGYLYYCPPQAPPAPPEPQQPEAQPQPEPQSAKPKFRANTTMYNPRQVPGDRCVIM